MNLRHVFDETENKVGGSSLASWFLERVWARLAEKEGNIWLRTQLKLEDIKEVFEAIKKELESEMAISRSGKKKQDERLCNALTEATNGIRLIFIRHFKIGLPEANISVKTQNNLSGNSSGQIESSPIDFVKYGRDLFYLFRKEQKGHGHKGCLCADCQSDMVNALKKLTGKDKGGAL